MAELYRAVDILGRAGLKIDSDFGVSDEGDPWFVFCRADNGDVIVHFARIDGKYVASSIAVDETFRGGDFREIIERIVQSQPLIVPPSSSSPRLFLHPGVVLTAFVATALMFSHRAEAADSINPSMPVTFSDGHSDGGASGLSGVLKQFFTEVFGTPGRPGQLADKHGDADGRNSLFLTSLIAIAIAATDQSSAPWVDDVSLLQLDSSGAGANAEGAAQVLPVAQIDLVDQAAAAASSTAVTTLAAADEAPMPAILIKETGITDGQAAQLSLGGVDHVQPAQAEVHRVDSAASATPLEILGEHSQVHQAAVAATTTTAVTQTASATSSSGYLFDGYLLSPEVVKAFGGVAANAHGGSSTETSATVAASTDSSATSTGHTSTDSQVGAVSTAVQSTSLDGGQFIIDPAITGHTTAATAAATAALSAAVAPGVTAQAEVVVSSAASAGSDPQATLTALVNYVFSNQHMLTGTLTESGYLHTMLSASGASSSTLLVVYDSKDMPYTIFPLTQGVLFVDDTELSSSQAVHISSSDTTTLHLANGGSVTLIGIITTDHLVS
ncbi:hypothetical protein [Telmatospirillum sp.]|uniref:hypothetical protein n=1 Tax=Telmatospirillum sp. TaxID=2079197 RepID=UPI00283F88B0|nr:hypothetical protein [Telmatospirillum sp.]MDR3441144.1 hypothetical protein [Telmatospirillum sp.]